MVEEKKDEPDKLTEISGSDWGEAPDDHLGYASEEDRHSKRGLEDWELVENISESQRNVPYWFIAVILVVLLVAIGLSFPFWGDREGFERSWINWGFGAAIIYLAVGVTFIYFMVTMYGSKMAGRLDSDPKSKKDTKDTEEAPNGEK